MDRIQFGTDGWRAKIAREFTMENVERVAQATALYFRKQGTNGRPVIIGYDNRFMAETFAARTAEVLCGNGLPVLLAEKALPTPVVSWGVKHFRSPGAVIITSSHNPFDYGGFKLKSAFGGSALPETTAQVEALLDRKPVRKLALAEARRLRLLKSADFDTPYLNKITSYVDLHAIRRVAQTVVFDPMYGSGIGYLEQALAWKRREPLRCRVNSIRSRRDPLFGGVNPEPIAENLQALIASVKEQRAHLGLAVDGDGDRIGVVDDLGNYISSHKVLALLLRHFVRNRHARGPVAKTISGTFLIDRMCEAYHLPLRETPIGFKHLGELILNHRFLLGGEESGGMGFHHYIPERDGILTCLLLLELVAVERKRLSALIKELAAEYGPFHYHRIDTAFPVEMRKQLLAELTRKPPVALDGVRVQTIKDFDGVKFILEDGSWLLIRPSGTEPILRLYSESPKPDRVTRLLQAGKRLAAQTLK